MSTSSVVAATNLRPDNWLVLLLQHFSALWVLCYISEVAKDFTTWLYVLQAALNRGSVLAEVAITCLSVALSPWKTNGDHAYNPISAEAKCCQSREGEQSPRPTQTRVKEEYTFSSAWGPETSTSWTPDNLLSLPPTSSQQLSRLIYTLPWVCTIHARVCASMTNLHSPEISCVSWKLWWAELPPGTGLSNEQGMLSDRT